MDMIIEGYNKGYIINHKNEYKSGLLLPGLGYFKGYQGDSQKDDQEVIQGLYQKREMIIYIYDSENSHIPLEPDLECCGLPLFLSF